MTLLLKEEWIFLLKQMHVFPYWQKFFQKKMSWAILNIKGLGIFVSWSLLDVPYFTTVFVNSEFQGMGNDAWKVQ